MTVGLSTANLANEILDHIGGSAWTAPTTIYVKLHEGDPGSAGTANASTETTRKSASWSAAAAGSKAMSGTLSWTSWSAGTETITHISLWDNVSAGNFLWSGQLTAPKTVNDGDTLNLTSLTLTLSPLAA